MEWNKENGDRRKEPRYKISIQTQVTTPDASIAATANNISGGGMEIQLHKGINPYTSLTVSIQIHEEFVFHGTVVWTLGDYIDKQWVYRAGIKTDIITYKDGKAVTAEEKRKLVQKILPKIRSKGAYEFGMSQKAA